MINRHFSLFSTFVHEESRTVLVLNPKVATKFSRRLLRRGVTKHLGREDPSNGAWPFLRAAREFPMPSPRQALALVAQPRRFEAFAIVRNPYTRCLSAWRSKLLHGHHISEDGRDSAYPISLRGRGLRAIRRFAAREGLVGAAPGTLVPFDTFVRFVVAGRAGRRDVHWDLQKWVIQSDHFRFARIHRMEDGLDAPFEELGARIGFPKRWTRRQLGLAVNVSPSHAGGAEAGFDAQGAALFRAAFAEDFELFGYDPDDWRAAAAPGAWPARARAS